MSKFNDKNMDEVPKDYFVKFGEKILDKTMEEEIFDTADFPMISSIKKEQDFTTPKNYLQNFKSVQRNTEPKRFSIYYVLGIAASILLVGYLFTLSTKTDIQNKEELATIDNIDYYLEDADALELSEIIELQELLNEEKTNEHLLGHVEDELLIDYLLEESDAYDLATIY